jgi:ribosomal protein RSM22 (predicted rRNA methylase)
MLPAALQAAIDARMHGVSRTAMAAASAVLSEHYRAGRASQKAIDSTLSVDAYLLARLPATYAAMHAALGQVAKALPAFQPKSILDLGAGPGTASWAACELWPGIERITMLDAHAGFRQTALELSTAADHPALRAATYRLETLSAATKLPPADLIVMGYALAEMPQAIATLGAKLWQACTGVALIVEPGTPAGYARILDARTAFIQAGAVLAAPCPHTAPCPITPPDWCHFSVRLARSRDHMALKGATVPYEDERFSYVAASRFPSEPVAARVLMPPVQTPAGIICKLCGANGQIETPVVSVRDKAVYKRYKKVKWGEGLKGI